MRFTRLKWKNLFSYGNYTSEIVLDQEGIHFVRGVNKDTNTSNGAGKSAILDIFVWVLYGKPLKSMPIDSIKNNHTNEEGYARIEFWISDDYYQIERWRGSKNYGNSVEVKRNGVPIENATNRDAQKRIDDIIGLDYAAFTASLIFSSEVAFQFPTLTPDKRREYIEQIMGLQAYSEYGREARGKTRAIKKDLTDVETSLRETKKFLSSEKDDYVKYSKQFEGFDSEKSESLFEMRQELKKATKAIEQCNYQEREALDKYEQDINADLEKYKQAKHPLELELSKVNSHIQSLQNEVKKTQQELEREINRLNKQQNKEISYVEEKLELVNHACPTCERDWDNKEVEELTAKYNAKKEDINQRFEAKKSELNLDISNSVQLILSELDSEKKDKESTERKLDEVTSEIEQLEESLESVKEEKKKYPTREFYDKLVARVESLSRDIETKSNQENPYREVVVNLKSKISKLIEQAEDLNDRKGDLESELMYASFWDESFNNDGLKLFIFESITPVLNARIAYYLPILFDGKDVTLEFDKMMNMTIVKEGESIPYGGLSQGERKRVDLAISLSLLETAQAQHGISSNIMFFDEIFDSSLDSSGVRTVSEILHTITVPTKFIISHRLEISQDFDNVIDVEKRGKFSRVLS